MVTSVARSAFFSRLTKECLYSPAKPRPRDFVSLLRLRTVRNGPRGTRRASAKPRNDVEAGVDDQTLATNIKSRRRLNFAVLSCISKS
jgi:hypothetical protein